MFRNSWPATDRGNHCFEKKQRNGGVPCVSLFCCGKSVQKGASWQLFFGARKEIDTLWKGVEPKPANQLLRSLRVVCGNKKMSSQAARQDFPDSSTKYLGTVEYESMNLRIILAHSHTISWLGQYFPICVALSENNSPTCSQTWSNRLKNFSNPEFLRPDRSRWITPWTLWMRGSRTYQPIGCWSLDLGLMMWSWCI